MLIVGVKCCMNFKKIVEYGNYPYICHQKMEYIATSRFDARLPKVQKLYFEKAAQLGGYRNLTDFVLSSVMEKAKAIISENEQILVSQQDSEVFFQAILQQTKPNQALMEAAEEYNQLLAE